MGPTRVNWFKRLVGGLYALVAGAGLVIAILVRQSRGMEQSYIDFGAAVFGLVFATLGVALIVSALRQRRTSESEVSRDNP